MDDEEQMQGPRRPQVPRPTELSKSSVLRMKGDRYVREGEFRRATRQYQRSIRLNPRDHVSWNNQGVALARLGEIREAIEARDRSDRDRAAGPLRPAPDAVTIDTTDLSIDEVVARICRDVEQRCRKND